MYPSLLAAFDMPGAFGLSIAKGSTLVNVSLTIDGPSDAAGEVERTFDGVPESPVGLKIFASAGVALRFRFMADGGSLRREEGDWRKGDEVEVSFIQR